VDKWQDIWQDACMTRQPTADAAAFGDRLNALHDAAGHPSWSRMSKDMLLASGGQVDVSDQQLSNYHHGRIDPGRVAFEVLVGIWRYYDCELDDLGPVAARRIRDIFGMTDDLRIDASGWFRRTATPVAA
jgi:hypothetical protein